MRSPTATSTSLLPLTMRSIVAYVSFICIVALSIIVPIHPVYAKRRDCKFRAIFNFGDSNSDTDGVAATFPPGPVGPYGATFFGKPTGRFSDGRLMIDFMAEHLGLPFLSAYLNSVGTNFTHGANFANAGASIAFAPHPHIKPLGETNPFYLPLQFQQFLRFKTQSLEIKRTTSSGVFGNLLPKKKTFSEALYTLDIGHNDLSALWAIKSPAQVKKLIPDLINQYSVVIKGLYGAGAKSFWIHSTDPIGCTIHDLFHFGSEGLDEVGCVKSHNEVAMLFNHKLKEAVVQLIDEFPSASFVFVDVYSIRHDLYKNAKKYGFEHPFVACCGYGGKHNFGVGSCGQTVAINSSAHVYVGACPDPSNHISWEGYHYTEAANKIIADQISSGKFSTPPVPLRMACQRMND